MKEKFIQLPSIPLQEFLFEVPDKGEVDVDFVVFEGKRVKVIISVPEERVKEIDVQSFKKGVLASGAISCNVPELKIRRKVVKRSSKQSFQLSLEDSLKLFSNETKVNNKREKIIFAAKLAREADNGVQE